MGSGSGLSPPTWPWGDEGGGPECEGPIEEVLGRGSGSAGLHGAAATLRGRSRQGPQGCKMSEHHRYRKQKGVIK